MEVPLGGLGSLLGKSEGLTTVGGAASAITAIMGFPIPESVAADAEMATIVTIMQMVTSALVAAGAIISYNNSRGRAKAGEEGVKK